MRIETKEHYDLMASFEKANSTERLDKEEKELWPKGQIYQDGIVNKLFISYRKGYALAKCIYMQ